MSEEMNEVKAVEQDKPEVMVPGESPYLDPNSPEGLLMKHQKLKPSTVMVVSLHDGKVTCDISGGSNLAILALMEKILGNQVNKVMSQQNG